MATSLFRVKMAVVRNPKGNPPATDWHTRASALLQGSSGTLWQNRVHSKKLLYQKGKVDAARRPTSATYFSSNASTQGFLHHQANELDRTNAK